MTLRLLLLGGTAEAREIAAALARMPEVSATLSLAGATRAPAEVGLPMRVGGFGGAAGLVAYLARERTDAVLDATHPFAAEISRNVAAAAAELGLPRLQVLRPEWAPGPGDDWHEIGDEAEAARLVPRGATVFLATGRQTLARFADLAPGRQLVCRRIDPPEEPFPFPGGAWQVGRPPFALEDEIALFSLLGVDWLVVKNAGGAASRSKLDAARALRLPVAMIRRPPPPPEPRAETVAEALAWVEALPLQGAAKAAERR